MLPRKRLLFVDDEPSIRLTLAPILQQNGFEVRIAATVPEALGDKIIHPFGDFLLHDIGTGDGIVQVGPQDTANKLRTAPLWGLRTKPRFMHDLRSLSLEDAISRHEGEAREPAKRFRELSPEEREALITFLNTL